jgi:hypothetical protein
VEEEDGTLYSDCLLLSVKKVCILCSSYIYVCVLHHLFVYSVAVVVPREDAEEEVVSEVAVEDAAAAVLRVDVELLGEAVVAALEDAAAALEGVEAGFKCSIVYFF